VHSKGVSHHSITKFNIKCVYYCGVEMFKLHIILNIINCVLILDNQLKIVRCIYNFFTKLVLFF
jgi:hypothetical protein